MKTLIVTQFADGQFRYKRTCVLEVPDDTEEKHIDDELLERLLDEEGVGWETDDFSGYSSHGHKIEGEVSDREVKRLPTISYPAHEEQKTA